MEYTENQIDQLAADGSKLLGILKENGVPSDELFRLQRQWSGELNAMYFRSNHPKN